MQRNSRRISEKQVLVIHLLADAQLKMVENIKRKRTMLDVVLFAGYTIGSVAGLMLLKQNLAVAFESINGDLDVRAWLSVAGGAALYICGFALWLIILTRMDLSVAYPIVVSVTLVFTSIGSWLWLGEDITPLRIAGLVLVFLGIIALVRS